ncbi:MAG: RNA polymerase factor sigma-32 [Alphaproteobacteria bacterium]
MSATRSQATPPDRPSTSSGFLRQAWRQPMLTRNEEVELARRCQEGDAAAAGRLINSHLRFVIKIARRYRLYGVPMADLIQEGTVGLIEAVRRFNPERNVRLATYAMWWIRAAIQDHVVRSWSLVRVGTTAAQKSLFFSLRRMRDDIREGADGLGEESLRNLAAWAKRSNVRLADALTVAKRLARRDQSLHVPLGGSDAGNLEWIDNLADDRPTPEEVLSETNERKFVATLLTRALAILPERERLIIRRRYLFEVASTLEALARELGISKERVRQLETRALAKLREVLSPALGEALCVLPQQTS